MGITTTFYYKTCLLNEENVVEYYANYISNSLSNQFYIVNFKTNTRTNFQFSETPSSFTDSYVTNSARVVLETEDSDSFIYIHLSDNKTGDGSNRPFLRAKRFTLSTVTTSEISSLRMPDYLLYNYAYNLFKSYYNGNSFGACCYKIIQDKIYFFGASIYYIDLSLKIISYFGNLKENEIPRYNNACYYNENFYFVPFNKSSDNSKKALVFNINSKILSDLPLMEESPGLVSGFIKDGIWYIPNGIYYYYSSGTKNNLTNKIYRYDILSNSWEYDDINFLVMPIPTKEEEGNTLANSIMHIYTWYSHDHIFITISSYRGNSDEYWNLTYFLRYSFTSIRMPLLAKKALNNTDSSFFSEEELEIKEVKPGEINNFDFPLYLVNKEEINGDIKFFNESFK